VDDEESQVRALDMGLRLEGFEVSTAREAESAMDALRLGPVDIAIVDLMMPGINGIELARKIRDLFPSTRVVLTSAYHLSETQVSRADCGVVGFVPKPYILAELACFLRAKLAPAASNSVGTSASSSPPSSHNSEARLRAS
jgi:DNA-binding response OmpR family regulator